MRKYTFTLLLLLSMVCNMAVAQIMNPVKWQAKVEMTGDAQGQVVLTAAISSGWHMYSLDCDPNAGPQILEITYPKLDGVTLEGKPTPNKAAHKQYDEMFGADLSWWTQGVVPATMKTASRLPARHSICQERPKYLPLLLSRMNPRLKSRTRLRKS